jgi:hypothetical protein
MPAAWVGMIKVQLLEPEMKANAKFDWLVHYTGKIWTRNGCNSLIFVCEHRRRLPLAADGRKYGHQLFDLFVIGEPEGGIDLLYCGYWILF